METSVFPGKEIIQQSTFCRKGYTNHFLGFRRAKRLKPEIHTKRREKPKKVLLQHDNARPHVAEATIQTINKLGFEVLEHPAYSPDLASSNDHLFAPLKDASRSRKFSSDEAVEKAVNKWLCDQPTTFFSDGFHKLVDRWNKCIEMGGDYVEK